MKKINKIKLLYLMLFMVPSLFLSGMVQASSYESKKKSLPKAAVQRAMKDYVKMHTRSGFLPIVYQGKILELKLAPSKKYPDAFHAGVKNHGSLYTSCADFVDQSGNRYDIDFLVNRSSGKYAVVQPIVHSVNGKKNPYDLAH